ncbi:branched-chain amino acid ABC transporter substrate-binding protein [Treponema sp.]
MKRIATIIALGLLNSLLFASGAQQSSSKEIVIGLQAPVSGAYAAEGQWARQSAEMAAELINAKGGVLGMNIKIELADDAGNPKDSALAAQKLISKGVKLVVGSYGSGITIPAADLYDAKGVVSIGYGCTAVRLTMDKQRPYFFRTCGRDDTQSAYFAKVVERMGAKRVAIMHDNSDYGKGVAVDAKRFLEPLVAAGKTEIIYYDAITPGNTDYTAAVQKLKTLKPDLWFYTSYYSEAGLLIKQARQAGLDCLFVGSNAVPNPEFVKIAGNAAVKGALMLNEPMPQFLDTKEATEFLNAYKAKYGEIPGSIWAVYAADAVNALAAAMKAALSSDPVAVEKALRSLSGAMGITGELMFDERGDRKNVPYQLYAYDEKGELSPFPLP